MTDKQKSMSVSICKRSFDQTINIWEGKYVNFKIISIFIFFQISIIFYPFPNLHIDPNQYMAVLGMRVINHEDAKIEMLCIFDAVYSFKSKK